MYGQYEFEHDIRRAFCPCARCTANRLLIHKDKTRQAIFSFDATSLGIYIGIAKQYQNGELD